VGVCGYGFCKESYCCRFRSFDKECTGKISEKTFKKILEAKDDVSEEEVKEMLEEYYRYV
jgi:Ca2+-binding EF-hand superfamily protein